MVLYIVQSTQSHSQSGPTGLGQKRGASFISQHVPAGLMRGLLEGGNHHDEGWPRSGLDGNCPRASQRADCGLRRSRSRRVLQHPAPIASSLSRKDPERVQSTVAQVFATPRTNRVCVCVCVCGASCIPHPRPRPHPHQASTEKFRRDQHQGARRQGETEVGGPDPARQHCFSSFAREHTAIVCSRHARPMPPSRSSAPAPAMARPTDQQRFPGVASNSEDREASFVPATACHVSIL